MRLTTPARLRLEVLEDRTVPSRITVGAMGDSFTDEYAPYAYGAGGDLGWVEQFRALRPEKVTVFNQAVSGASSTALLAGGQHTAVAALVRERAVDSALLLVGGRDSFDQIPAIAAGDPAPFVTTLLANLETALDTVLGAGPVNLVLGNVPTPVVAPAIQRLLPPPVQTRLTAAIRLANDGIARVAGERGLPVLDLHGLANLTLGPVTLGGVTVGRGDLFAVDDFHLGTVMQGLIANTFLEALEVGYGVNTNPLRLRDREILDLAGTPSRRGPPTYFDVSPFVIYAAPSSAAVHRALTLAGGPGAGGPAVPAGGIDFGNHADAGLALSAPPSGTAEFDREGSVADARGPQGGARGPGGRSAAAPATPPTLGRLAAAEVARGDNPPPAWSEDSAFAGADGRRADVFLVGGLFGDGSALWAVA